MMDRGVGENVRCDGERARARADEGVGDGGRGDWRDWEDFMDGGLRRRGICSRVGRFEGRERL